MMSEKVIHFAGKRKTAIARATLREGTGKVRINSVPLGILQPEVARMRIQETLMLASQHLDLNKIDINVKVEGGGIMGQSDAVSSAIARGLVKFSDNNELLLNEFLNYDRTLIAGDHRLTEVHKPSQSSKGPRHRRQKSYR